MGNWTGFTDRLRRHGRSVDSTTRGYLNVAADRIEDLEAIDARLGSFLRRIEEHRADPYSGDWYDLCQDFLREGRR